MKKQLDLVKRINRARISGEDVAPLERELEAAIAASKIKPPKITRAERYRRDVAKKNKCAADALRYLIRSATYRGKSLGWVMQEYKRQRGNFPGRALWKTVVGRDTRDAVIDAMVTRAAMEARSTGF